MEDNKEGKIENKKKVKKTEEEMTGTELMQEMINLDPDDKDEVSMKAYLLERVFYSFVLPFYDKGILLFFEEDDKLFGDKVLISTYSEGDTKEHSEKMGIDMKKHFVIDEYVLIPKSSIKFFEVSQNTCPNPDCEACDDGELQPATLAIVTEARTISLLSFTQADALELMILLNCWKEGGLKQFIETPFKDEDSFENRQKRKKAQEELGKIN